VRCMLVCAFLSVLSAAASAGEPAAPEAPAKRVLFEFEVPIGEEAPWVAVEGNTAAFPAGKEIRFVDVRTGKVTATRTAIPKTTKPKGQIETRVLGMVDGCAYAMVRYYTDPDRPDPAGEVGVLGWAHAGWQEIVAVKQDSEDSRHIGDVFPSARVADRLFGTSVVCLDGKTLRILPVKAGGEEKKLELDESTPDRPLVRNGVILGATGRSVYRYRPGDADVQLVPFRGTALEQFAGHSETISLGASGDLLVVSAIGSEVVCCDSAGKLRWKSSFGGTVLTGTAGEIVVVGSKAFSGHDLVIRFDPHDGRVLWRRCIYASPSGKVYGYEAFVGGMAIFNTERLLVLDPASGKTLVEVERKQPQVRGVGNSLIAWTSMAASGACLIVGFEKSVYGVSLTPDPRPNLSSVPVSTPVGLALSRGPEGVRQYLKAGNCSVDEGRAIVNAFACEGAPEKVQPVLKAVLSDPAAYRIEVREAAARLLRSDPDRPKPPRADLLLLYGGDSGKTAAEFRRRLLAADDSERKRLGEMLKSAPDSVLVELAPDLAGVPGSSDAVRAARERLAAMAKM